MKHDYKAALEDMQDDTGWCVVHQKAIRSALELAIALQPKPISEAPTGEDLFLAHQDYVSRGWIGPDKLARTEQGMMKKQPTHYYDISALPKVEETNED